MILQRVLEALGLPIRPLTTFGAPAEVDPSRRRYAGGGYGSYAAVQRRRAANRVARRSRRINRRRSR